MAKTVSSVVDLIGNTPLIRLKAASEATGCDIYGKAEFLNPGQSIKDRAALWIIRDHEKKGTLKPGGTIVEGTAGNTGIGLAMVANALGYKCVIVIPRTQAQEKKDAIRQLGAQLIEVDAVPYANPNNYVRYSGTLAQELGAASSSTVVWANQFDNVANRQAHIDGTGPEILAQILDTPGGKLDGFICAVGSGGTLGGLSLYFKSQNPDIQIGLADPYGAALYSYYTTGELKSEGSSITEGIGQGRITANLDGITIDRSYQVADDEWLPVLYDMIQTEGLCLGTSAALNVVGAMKMAKDLGPGKTIVTVLCDYGNRYASKIFNPAFLKEKGLPTPPWYDLS
ncbi:cysteine synthase [Asticcacaulis biprosthecium C19]|uniref:Cysteine synthase n=1 Tax=Asticcacaulis biprosthecium C19 TaxID=715226 RepID=F4QLS7_9CAUL|nr:cysteine synthase A [Asticcacaulis biprosthecium]EGF92346.1 cysteine synthase [Asticcacaulis biprosthecium C19]